MNDMFSFGKVKDKRMLDILNMPRINGSFSGLQYLVGMHEMTTHKYIKEEIEECLKKYSGDYVLKFGKYSNKTIKEINNIDSQYIKSYLIKNDNKEIRMLVQYYIKFNSTSETKVYNKYQEEAYKRNAYLIEEINSRSIEEIKNVIRSMGFDINDDNYFLHCPFECENKVSYFEHAKLIEGKNGTYLVYCYKCDKSKNFIEFVQEKMNFTKPKAIKWIAGILAIIIIEDDFKINIDKNKDLIKHSQEIELDKRQLEEITLEEYGFVKGVYPTYFYNRGFKPDDAEIMEVYFAGKNCRNNFRNRICFVVKDIDQRIVGVVGRNKYSEQEFYNYWIKRNEIDLTISRDDQIQQVKKYGNVYKKYYNNEGFKKGIVLYGENTLTSNEENVIIVEGPFDVMGMKVHHGYKNTVAMMGKVLSSGQLYKLYSLYKDRRYSVKVYLFIDNDEAGLNAFEKNVQLLQEVGFTNVYKIILQDAKDAAEATKIQVDDAYRNSQLQTIRYKKKRIVINDIDSSNKYIDEE